MDSKGLKHSTLDLRLSGDKRLRLANMKLKMSDKAEKSAKVIISKSDA
jgi:hypothetical protein